MDQFQYSSYAQEVIFGPDALIRLGAAVERLTCQRLIICASHSIRANGHLALIENVLGNRAVAVFDQVRPHVQNTQLREILALAFEKKADAVLGMGGGSPIGMAKALAAEFGKKQSNSSVWQRIPVIAIPTTYAGSEMTAVYGITHTDETPARKVTVTDPRIAPALVIYAPELTLDLPAGLSASTGINALAHCIEALYSKTRNPLSTAAAMSGLRYIFNSLLRCYQDGKNLEARSEMLLGAHLAGLSLASVSMGLHHGLCHVLGGSANIPHGIANSIILPHAIRFNAQATAAQLLPVADLLGIPVSAGDPQAAIEAVSQRIGELIRQMNLPQRLRDAGVPLQKSELPKLAQLGFENRSVQNNPRPVTDAAQIEKLLNEAW
jgi:maleylacetate reductase